tara:strand:- start:611 stop:985 length:375 start_codon:yes stop_codon:yes gene_type:complete
MSAAERIMLSQFLSWVALWCGIYFLTYFAPSPHPRENVSDMESYFSKRLPYSFTLLELGPIILPAFTFGLSDPSALMRMAGIGLVYIFLGFILSVAIDKYGIRIVKAIFTFLYLLLFLCFSRLI